MEREQYLCLDVGGTQIKAACVDARGGVSGEICYFPARADEGAECILDHFADIIRKLWPSGTRLAGIRMAFPGPFDYGKGVCLMRGLGKYEHLYQISVRAGLSERLGVGQEDILFSMTPRRLRWARWALGRLSGQRAHCLYALGQGVAARLDWMENWCLPARREFRAAGMCMTRPFWKGASTTISPGAG